jgi:acyl-CoA thioester hydrolase
MTSVPVSREFILPIRIYYEDTDAGGIVYHTNYLKFMERARTEWLRELGFEQDDMARAYGALFVVKRVAVEYSRPARFNDKIAVVSAITRCGRASVEFEQNLVRDAVRLVSAQVKVGCVDIRLLRPCAIPTEIFMELRNAAC